MATHYPRLVSRTYVITLKPQPEASLRQKGGQPGVIQEKDMLIILIKTQQGCQQKGLTPFHITAPKDCL